MIRLEAFSRFLNAPIGGSEYESLSARAYKAGNEKLINWIFFWQNNHCRGEAVSSGESEIYSIVKITKLK